MSEFRQSNIYLYQRDWKTHLLNGWNYKAATWHGYHLSINTSSWLFLPSIEVHEIIPAVQAIETLSDENVWWEEVRNRLIEKVRNNKLSGSSTHAHNASVCCGKCGKQTKELINVCWTLLVRKISWISSQAMKKWKIGIKQDQLK